MSGDLRAASRRGEFEARRISPATSGLGFEPPLTPPLNDEERVAAAANMANVYVSEVELCRDAMVFSFSQRPLTYLQEGWGDVQATTTSASVPGSGVSPTRPPSMRKRQSMLILDLESRMNDLVSENQRLQHDRDISSGDGDVHNADLREALEASELQLREKDAQINEIRAMLEPLQHEIARLNEVNGNLSEANNNLVADANDRYATLQEEHAHAHEQWQQSNRELDNLR